MSTQNLAQFIQKVKQDSSLHTRLAAAPEQLTPQKVQREQCEGGFFVGLLWLLGY
jgi:hypothetical protein